MLRDRTQKQYAAKSKAVERRRHRATEL